MTSSRDDYIPPVGFAREPHAERRRWLGRILLSVLVVFIVWLLVYRVINPSDTNDRPNISKTTLPAPQ